MNGNGIKGKLKTRYCYTEYVNHMIRFYITCPDSLKMDGKKRVDVENWIAVQGVIHSLPDDEREKVMDVYRTHYNLPKAVDMYCQKTGTDKHDLWVLLTKVASVIAKRRGLV